MGSGPETHTGESTKSEPTPPWNLTKTTEVQSGGGDGSEEDHKLNTQGLYK